MAKVKHNSPIVVAYAQALLDMASEAKQAEAVEKELAGLEEVMQAVPSFKLFLADPSIGEVERANLLKKTLGGQVSTLMHNFLGVMNAKGRLGLLPQVIETYSDLLDEQMGKIEVDVTVAQKLDAEQLEQVRRKVSDVLKKDAVVHQYVDEKIIGGLVLRVQDKLIDASVATQLRSIRRQMLAARD